MGMIVLLMRVIHGCFKASDTVYRCVKLNWVSRSNRFFVRYDRCDGYSNCFDDNSFYL